MNITSMLLIAILVFGITPILFAANLWYDNFDNRKLNADYITPSGGNGAGDPEWIEEGDVVKQIEPKPGDPTYLAIELDTNLESFGQLVKIRFDEWQDHDRSRAGVGFWLDPGDKYNGYTTVIHNSLTVGNYQFLNDARAWHGTQVNFKTGGVGSWFWMKSYIDADAKTMNGKVWVGELKDEPKGWMNETDYTTYGGLRNPTKWVGLNGGAGAADGFSTVSFDEWYVFDADGPRLTKQVDSKGKLALTWGATKK